MVRRNKQLKKNNNYLIVINNKDISKKILEDVGFIRGESSFFNPNFMIPEELIKIDAVSALILEELF